MLYHFHSSAWVVTLGDWDDFRFGYNVCVHFCCRFVFLFFPADSRWGSSSCRAAAPASSTATHVTLRLLAAPPVRWCLWWSPLLLQTSLNRTTITHGYGQFSHSRVKTDTSASFSEFFFLFCHCQFTQRLYISPKNRLKELCPKECVYKLPI